MELEHEYLSCWDKVYSATLPREESCEMIVPDACPDIARLLDGEGKILLQGRELTQGRAELSGCVKVGVLYCPEGGGSLCSLEALLPFRASAESGAFGREGQLHVTCCIDRVDVRALNPRKILVKVNFSLTLSCYVPQRLALCRGAAQPEEHGICQRHMQKQARLCPAVADKPFSYSDVVSIPSGKPALQSLLRTRCDCRVEECKLIGSKLLFKGEAQVELLYCSTEGSVCTVPFALPFSQMMEIGDMGEEAYARVQVCFCDLSCRCEDEEGREVSLDLELLAQAVVYRSERLELLEDLYSTEHLCQMQKSTLSLSQLMDRGLQPLVSREQLDCAVEAEGILDVSLRPLGMTQRFEGEMLLLEAEMEAFALLALPEGEQQSVTGKFVVQQSIPASSAWQYHCEIKQARPATAQLVSGGLEIAFALDFSWEALAQEEVELLEDLQLLPCPEEEGQKPSLLIRSVRRGESLWDIGKSYRSRAEQIIEANDLASEELYYGQMLLIPR